MCLESRYRFCICFKLVAAYIAPALAAVDYISRVADPSTSSSCANGMKLVLNMAHGVKLIIGLKQGFIILLC